MQHSMGIRLILMYLTLALLRTVVNEFIATKLKLRANSLASALEVLLDDEQLRQEFYKHGLIVGAKKAATTGTQSALAAAASLVSTAVNTAKTIFGRASEAASTASPPSKGTTLQQDHPSYLSSGTFALALIGSLDTTKPIPGFADVASAVTATPESKLRDALLSSLTEAQGDLNALRTSIATFFDDSMDRQSSAYKRQLKWISMFIGLVVAIAVNADSFKVATTLWQDPVRRAAAVEKASTISKTPQAPQDDQAKYLGDLRGSIATTEQRLRFLSLGRRCDTNADRWLWEAEWKPAPAFRDAAPALSLDTDGPALSPGAPFWFDLLGKVTNLRGTGAKPPREA